jgi:hypothetical protein
MIKEMLRQALHEIHPQNNAPSTIIGGEPNDTKANTDESEV